MTRKQPKVSQSYSLKPSTVRLVAAAAARRGINPSQFAEEALRYYALANGPVGVESSYEEQAATDERELVAAEDRGQSAA